MIVKSEKIIEEELNSLFSQQEVSFTCYTLIPEEKSEIWTQHILEIKKDNIKSGYIKLTYYDPINSFYKINNVLDYFAVFKSNKSPDKWLIDKDISFFEQFSNLSKNQSPVSIIEEMYKNQYENFMQTWSKKPNVELVKIYDENDINCANHKVWPAVKESREVYNSQGKGLGKTLYWASGIWMEKLSMHIWNTNKQTQAGKKIWDSLNKYPQFLLGSEIIKKNTNGVIQEIKNPFLKIR